MITKKQAGKKGIEVLKALIGGGVGYSLGRYGMYGGLLGIILAPKEWKTASVAALAAGTAGAAQPTPESPFMPDIMGNAKMYAAGGAKALFIDKIAPEVVAKLESSNGVAGLGNLFEQFFPDSASQLSQMNTSESAIRLNQASAELGTVSASAIRLQEKA